MDISLRSRLRTLCKDIDSSFSRRVESLLVAGNWDALATLEVKPQDYDDGTMKGVASYKMDAALAGLFVKNESLDTTFDRRKASLARWFESEKRCALTNVRFSSYRAGYYPDVDWRVVEFLHRVRRRVARILGPLPAKLTGKFGPGATYESSINLGPAVRSLTTVDKISWLWGTAPALELASYAAVGDRFLQPERWGLPPVPRVTIRTSRWSSVPKNAKTDRSIGMEPGVNVYLQLGVARAMHVPLLRCGIDLVRQQDRHRFLARNALSLGLATLDESMASDLWAIEAVRFFLGDAPDWLALLEAARTPFMEVDGSTYRLEKFSSMGNGFTFPLQTLLFYAITREIAGEDAVVSVFGDDIIAPADKAEDVMAALRFAGHKPNDDKSFYVGGFRESCGEDFFYGHPVRPHYLTEWPMDPPSWISFANGLRRRDSGDPFTRLHAWVRRQIPLQYRLGGPSELGDAVIHGARARWRRVNGCKQVRGVQYIGREVDAKHFDFSSLLTAALFGISYKEARRGNRVRDLVPTRGTDGFRLKWYSVVA